MPSGSAQCYRIVWMTINTCIIPAAGRGTRWAPVSGYLPKEMLPLVDKPVIERVIEETAASGCKQIIIVINKQKELIRKHLSGNKKLTKKTHLSFVYQQQPLGMAHAILLCQKLIGGNAFGVALPDLPVIARTPAMKQLINISHRVGQNTHLVSFDKFSKETRHLYGECSIKQMSNNLLKINHFCPKQKDPAKPHHPANFVRMSGHFIFTPQIFPIIETLMKKRKKGEVSDRAALREAFKSGQRVVGVKIIGRTYDTGYPKGYIRANTAFFKKFKMS